MKLIVKNKKTGRIEEIEMDKIKLAGVSMRGTLEFHRGHTLDNLDVEKLRPLMVKDEVE